MSETEMHETSTTTVRLSRYRLLALVTMSALLACDAPDPEQQLGTATAPERSASKPTSSLTTAPSIAAPSTPNLVIITLDTTRADALGAYGQRWPVSPRIDRMAVEGVLFDQAVTSSPETLPSHSTIFTGLQPYAHGVRENAGYVLPEENRTLAEILADEGYNTAAEIASLVLRDDTRIAQGFANRRDPSSPGVRLKQIRLRDGDKVRTATRQTRTGADISDRGIEFIQRQSAAPFFLWLHYFDPHDPYSAPAQFNLRIPESPYHAEVASADFQVGRVLDAIDAAGLRERTLVVLTADHGEGLGEHNELSHSYFVYDTTARVPLIFWGLNDLPRGARIPRLVRSVDITPTVLELLGLPALSGIDGTSLVPLLRDGSLDLGLEGYGEATRFSVIFGMPPIRFLRRGRWKYIHKMNPELYDVIADPSERHNQIESRPELAAKLRGALEALVKNAPAAPQNAATAVDAATAAELVALGYASAGAGEMPSATLASLALAGTDPVEKMEDVGQLSIMEGYIQDEKWQKAHAIAVDLVERNPESPYILARYADVLFGEQRYAEAIPHLERSAGRDLSNLESARKLARAFKELDRVSDSIALQLRLLEKEVCHEATLVSLNQLLRAQGRFEELLAVLSRGEDQCPDLLMNMNNYAWALATLPRDDLRDGKRAVGIAGRALEKLGIPDPGYRDTLAVAHAETGNFVEAERIQAEVVRQAEAQAMPAALVDELRAHLDAFRARQPVRDPAS
jgi:arylsulfatase A-like enzyme